MPERGVPEVLDRRPFGLSRLSEPSGELTTSNGLLRRGPSLSDAPGPRTAPSAHRRARRDFVMRLAIDGETGNPPEVARARTVWRGWLGSHGLLLAILAGAIGVRSWRLGTFAFWTDELYHVIAARSLIETGTPFLPG